jgi:kynureninase
MPKSVPARIARLLEQEWGDDLIRGSTKDGWMDLPLAVGAKIGSLIGAAADETVVADSTSVNLFKVLGAALKLRPDRRVSDVAAGNVTQVHACGWRCRQLHRSHRWYYQHHPH